jgi:hypothetical protein
MRSNNKTSLKPILALVFIAIIGWGINGSLSSQETGYFLGIDDSELKFDEDSPLNLNEEDIQFAKRDDGYFDIYIRKKPSIQSVLVTSIPGDDNYVTSEIYGLRASDYNPVNGDEKRIFDGEFLELENRYFLVDSSTEPALPFFDNAFHILVPPLLEYGYEYIGQYGMIRLKEGMKINIRTYDDRFANNRANFLDNIFTVSFDDTAPTVKLLGYEEINKQFIKIFVRYEDDKDYDSMFIKESKPKNERFKALNVINNVVPEDMAGQLVGMERNPDDGSLKLRMHIDIKRPEEQERTVVVTAIDKSGNSAKTPIVFTIKPMEKTEEPEEEKPIEEPERYDDRTVDTFKDIANETGGKNLISESPENLPEKIIQAINDATKGYDGDDLDLIFAIDSTGSMSDDIDYVKQELKSILRTITDQFQFANLGMVLYKDRGDDFVSKTYPFTQDLTRFKMQIDSVRPEGGGDKPEAIIDALETAIKDFSWTAGKRVIILMGDAPPHEYSVDGKRKTIKDIYDMAKNHDITIQIYTITVPTF